MNYNIDFCRLVLIIQSFLVFQVQRSIHFMTFHDVFIIDSWSFRPKDEVKQSNDPLWPHLIWPWFFWAHKNNSKIFFNGSLTGSGSKVHRFDQPTEVIRFWATLSYYHFLLCISGSLYNVGLSFKNRKKTLLNDTSNVTRRTYNCSNSVIIKKCAKDAALKHFVTCL